ncbi:MAG: hypothetical protein Q8O35_11765 [Humidesulfovibrio sp.]|uniref:hypothetical protein n=1 Tax=Humidesulfovibrio sp. TaxID=2910988 RepID=UPI0027365A3F|nr:hypothetical protein [Humidesulfovibrio sp.]MDP2848851.1 hypothetical protein [Humidesulfovibrio sp.]
MIRPLLALLLLPLLALPALAQDYAPPPLDDPLALRLICTSTQEWTNYGPSYSRATIFSVPEPDGRTERLYVGFVGDILYSRTGHAFWRGPVATRWQGLREAREWIPKFSAKNPARYRLDRLTALPGGRMDNATMEIDLDARPPQLRLLGGGPGQPKYLDSQPLGEAVPMTETLKFVTRLRQQAKADTGTLGLRTYAVNLGKENPPVDRLNPLPFEESDKSPYLLAVCRAGDPGVHALHFLPPRYDSWIFEKLLAAPTRNDADGSFVLRIFSLYLGKDGDGDEAILGSRSDVSVGLRNMDVKLVESQLYNDPESGSWYRPKPTKKGKP